jgi:hypothetical protein
LSANQKTDAKSMSRLLRVVGHVVKSIWQSLPQETEVLISKIVRMLSEVPEGCWLQQVCFGLSFFLFPFFPFFPFFPVGVAGGVCAAVSHQRAVDWAVPVS